MKLVIIMMGLFAAVAFMPGCGGGGGAPSVTSGVSGSSGGGTARVTGLAMVPQDDALLARAPGEDAARAVQQSGSTCGSPPSGYVPLANATITVSGESTTTTTDAYGCYSLDLSGTGAIVITATKTNKKGGTTTLKIAADVSSGDTLSLTGSSGMDYASTAAAMIVEQKQSGGETDIDVDSINDFCRDNQTEPTVAALMSAIEKSADPDQTDVANFNAIPATLVTSAEANLTKPVIVNPSVTWSNMAVTISATITDDGSVVSVAATITPAGGGTPVNVTLAAGGAANTYSGSYTFSTTGLDTSYSVSITATDNDGNTYTYAAGSGASGAYVSSPTAFCGDGRADDGEQCDDGNTTTETCTYGQTSCTVCNASCQSVAGAVSYCGDSATDTANNEDCDDGNAVTDTCTYGSTASCIVCNSSCQTVPGAACVCGDGVTDTAAGETCDDGNAVTESCTYGQTSCTVCNASCQSVSAAVYCGDGTIQSGDGEQCDNGNTTNNDGCSSTCQTETFSIGVNSMNVCVVLPSTGGLKCWGNNDYNQVGNGGYSNVLSPEDVTGLTSGVSMVDVGTNHACAVTTTGGAKCWGRDDFGQVGESGDTYSKNEPMDVAGLTSGVSQVAAGQYHSCALLSTGAVKCWGYNNSGQLGNGNQTTQHTPVNVLTLGAGSGVIDIDAGASHTCAVLDTGAVKCWGSDFDGQLGYDGVATTSNQTTPVEVEGITNAASISCGGDTTCVLTTGGGVYCFGENVKGEAGEAGGQDRHTPGYVFELTSGMTSVHVSELLSCGITTSQGVKCWGGMSYYLLQEEGGQFSYDDFYKPRDINGYTSNVVALGIQGGYGGAYILVVTSDKGIQNWGLDNYRRGNGTYLAYTTYYYPYTMQF